MSDYMPGPWRRMCTYKRDGEVYCDLKRFRGHRRFKAGTDRWTFWHGVQHKLRVPLAEAVDMERDQSWRLGGGQ